MKHLKLLFAIILAFTVCSCGAKNSTKVDSEKVENEGSESDSSTNTQDYSDLIKTVYEEFVFTVDANPSFNPENYFTAKALKKLKDSYEFDCENNDCYAFYELRTQEQDSKPGTTGESSVISIESMGDDWYIVTYSDMGWSGITRVKIADGKIDDFERCVKDL